MVKICKYTGETKDIFLFEGEIKGVAVKLGLRKNGGDIFITEESARELERKYKGGQA